MPAQANGSGAADGGVAVEAATAQAASLSLADSSLPLWFKPELFVGPEFNPVAYVADLKRYVSACGRGCVRSDGGGGQPLVTKQAPDFLACCALQVPLETLSSELHSHLDALKNKLVEVGAARVRCLLACLLQRGVLRCPAVAAMSLPPG